MSKAAILFSLCAAVGQAFPAAAEEPLEAPITAGDRDHWSFRPLRRPSPPKVQDESWSRSPVDEFILAKLEEKGLRPMPPARKTALLRRLCFDLLGVPPQPGQIERFQRDQSPDAYERLVESLLASPLYGERWAQHWLDLARFAETDGFEHDQLRPQAWKYRDWVIQALNRDVPYDRFVRWQIAGDELQPNDEGAATATAFCLSGPDMPDINSQEERRHYLLNDVTATVGEAFLGLQMGCAQCHDHKYDPISQADFYRLRAVFEPAVQVQPNKSVYTLGESNSEAKPSFLMIRGDWRRPGATLQPGVPRIAQLKTEQALPEITKEKSTGRRTALARWLTQANHPLTSRTIANRLWQHHFGEGLSRTPNDFGLMGDEPTHLELLDWLSTELVRQRWSLKAMHRQIVLSATYRQAGHVGNVDPRALDAGRTRQDWERSLEQDPNNLWLARFPVKRLEGEAIRDAMLCVSGLLNRRAGGPGVMAPLPSELTATLLRNQWKVNPRPSEHARRSIYLFARRNLRYPIFEVFDRPDGIASCARRSRSTTAPQALLMLNSESTLQFARHFAARVLLLAGSDPRNQVETAVRLAFGRLPEEGESRELIAFLTPQQRDLPDDEERLPQELVDLCLALLNANEFVYVN